MTSEINDEVKMISKDQRCSPDKRYENGSCISKEHLILMAEEYNKMYPDKIKLSFKNEAINSNKYKQYLSSEFKKRLSNVCDDQLCWIRQDFMKKMNDRIRTSIKESFRPKGPEGKFEWLNTVNIEEVLKQYERVNNDFKFLGAVPMDFDDFPQFGISNLNFDHLIKESKTKFGIVFNLDDHNQPGSHWVSMYFDFNQYCIYYFDSCGLRPERRVIKFIKRIAKHMKTINPLCKLKIEYNTFKHQLQNTECGVYSILFIICCVKDPANSFNKLNKRRITDEEVNEFREVFFT